MVDSRSLRRACAVLFFIAGSVQAAAPLAARIEQAARERLVQQLEASGLAEPQLALSVVTTRAAPPCSQAPSIEPLDTRNPARMRFAVRCADAPGWRLEYIVRAKVSAMVAVTAAPVAAGQLLADDDLVLERREIGAMQDAIGTLDAAVGQASRRTLRAGEVLRRGQLAAPILVKRGEPVVMVARHAGIEVSTAGEALDSGAEGAAVRVRNVANGRVVRMRVIAAGTVEPVEMPRITR